MKPLLTTLLTLTCLALLPACDDPATGGDAPPPQADNQADAPAPTNAILTAPVPDNADDVEPLRQGDPVPVVELRDADDQPVNLGARLSQQPTMLVFYRGGWCPYCNQQLSQLAQAEQAITGMGIQILAVSPDRPARLRDNPLDADLNYELLSDSDMALSRAFGLAFQVDEQTRDNYHDHGIDLEDASGQSHHLLPVPAVYLIDTDHRIHFAHWDADYTDRLAADTLIEAAEQMTP